MTTALIIAAIVLLVVVPTLLAAAVLWQVALEYRRDRVPILLYHRLLSKADAERGLVPDDEMIWVSYDASFAEQMNYLKRAGYTTLDLDDYVQIRAGRMPMPQKPVIVTFDDGYLSTYRMGYPVLKQLGLKAVVFVPPHPDDYTRDKIKGVDDFVSAEQMREMAENGVAIQSHTMTHCVLAELDAATAMHELTESRKLLHEFTGRSVEHIAIPRSGYSRRVKRQVAEAGYKTACCNRKGTANGLTDLLALPRIVIERDMTVADFARALTPRGAAMLRIVGNLKRIPELIGGSTFAGKVRRVLYNSPLKPLFQTRNLKKLVLLAGVGYMGVLILLVWMLVARGQ